MFLFLATLMGALLIAVGGGSAAHASAPETPGGDQEKTDFYFGGSIKHDSEAIPDVVVRIEGAGGFTAETSTDAEGRWRLYVPERATYTLTLDEATLPEGIVVEGDSAVREVEFGAIDSAIVNVFLGEGVRETTGFGEQLLVRVVGGLNFGLLLALAAMGAALIYGTTGLSNFAHGEMVTWGAVCTFVITALWQGPVWLGLLGAVIGGAALGYAMDVALWRPLRRRGLGIVQLMIVSIGLSLALRYAIQFMISGGTYQLPGASPTPINIGPIRLSYIDMISMAVCIVAILGVAYFLLATRVGKATRAISDNPGLAAASGINVDRVVRIVWVLAALLAAVAGVLWAYFRPGLRWDMGTQMLLLIFAAITLGGLGTAFGALLGAIIVGLVVETSTLWIPSDLKYAGALVVLILILLVRPQGLLGRKERLG